jgi:hypothetical protein
MCFCAYRIWKHYHRYFQIVTIMFVNHTDFSVCPVITSQGLAAIMELILGPFHDITDFYTTLILMYKY